MGELVISVIFIILSIFMYINSNGFTSNFSKGSLGAAGFPKLIAILIFILSIAYIFKYLKNKIQFSFKFDLKKLRDEYRFVFITLLLFLIYIVSMKFIGFIISTISYLLLSQWFLSDKKTKNLPIIIITTLFISLGTYYFFTSYLSVIFPVGIFFE